MITSVTQALWRRIALTPWATAELEKIEGHTQYDPRETMTRGAGRVAYTNKETLRPGTVSWTWQELGLAIAEGVLFLEAEGVKSGDRVAVNSWNCLQFKVMKYAIHSIGAIEVPLPINAKPDELCFVINHSAPKLIVCDTDKSAQLINGELLDAELRDNLVGALFSDVFQHVPSIAGKKDAPNPCQFREEAFTRYQALVDQFTTLGAVLPYQKDDISTLIYTSGSTSKPKGAMISHDNIAGSCELLVGLGFDFGPQDINMHWLPPYHSYCNLNGIELASFLGVVSCFSNPPTLPQDLPLYRPTAFLGVPRIWNRMKGQILKEWKAHKLAAWAFELNDVNPNVRRSALRRFVDITFAAAVRASATRFIRRKTLKKMGMDFVKIMMSGSAALERSTANFFLSLTLEMREGYGLTETCGGIFGNTLTHFRVGSLGRPGPGIEAKLVRRVDETGAFVDPEGSGVLWVRGRPVFKGYWNDPEKTAEVFDKDGFFCTGDVVRRDEDGFYWYIGRSGRQKKLDTGEFYSEDTIATGLERNEIVQAAVPTGLGKPCIGALIFIDKLVAARIAGSAPAGVDALEYYAQNEKVLAAVAEAVKTTNKGLDENPDAKPYERVRKWAIVPFEATIDNGLLTPIGKIKMEAALKRFEAQVDALYA